MGGGRRYSARMRLTSPSLLLPGGLALAIACHGSSPTRAEGAPAPGPVVGSTGDEAPPPAPLDAFARAMVDAHNRVRREVRPAPATPLPALAWDADLARLAQSWADSCPSSHRPDNAYGENMFFSGGAALPPEAAVSAWADEASSYDYQSTVCSRGGRQNWAFCGHYTQVVWRDTLRVGCGIRRDCAGSYDTVVVCNYDPPGNMNATQRRIPRPY